MQYGINMSYSFAYNMQNYTEPEGTTAYNHNFNQ